MNLLAIETSTTRASIALRVEGRVFTCEETTTHEHARVLLVMIEQLLLEAGVGFDAIDGIVLGAGPGSFTGVRIAVSIAKGLAYAHDLPLFPVNGLHCIAFDAARRFKRPVLAMIDARMHQVYWAYQPDSGACAVVSAPGAVQLPVDAGVVLAGVAFAPYVQALSHAVQEAIVLQHTLFPEAAVMIEMVDADIIPRVTAENALPLYVREQVTG